MKEAGNALLQRRASTHAYSIQTASAHTLEVMVPVCSLSFVFVLGQANNQICFEEPNVVACVY